MAVWGGIYAVRLLEIGLDGGEAVIRDGFGRTMVDTGTTLTLLPRVLYKKLRASVIAHWSAHSKMCGTSRKSCWATQDGFALLSAFPTLKVTFQSGGSMRWRPESYIYRRGGQGLFCLGFED